MPLPKLNQPIFEMLVPSQNKKVRFRPFLVKEEKILLFAQQSDNEKDIIFAIKQILQNCIVDKFDVNSLCTFDLEYMFLKLRSRSVNNVIEVSYRDTEDDKVYDFTVDLEEVDIVIPPNTTNKIQITDNIGLIMKYPSITLLDSAPENATPLDMVEYLVRSCIDQVYDEEEVYFVAEQPKEEVDAFIDSLDVDTYEKIRSFFNELPRMHHKLEYKNSLGHDRVIEMSSLRDFFTLG